jgi:hypothetical protein
MTQDEIIEMAKQAGFDTDLPPFKDGTAIALKLAALVASAEREACAKIVLNEAYQYTAPVWAVEIVNDIRARGQA